MILKRINRNKKTSPDTKHSFWCTNCDLFCVSSGEKCPHCGVKREPPSDCFADHWVFFWKIYKSKKIKINSNNILFDDLLEE